MKEDSSSEFIQNMKEYMSENSANGTPNQMWTDFHQICTRTALSSLGVSRGAFKDGRETWWWNPSVEESIANKRKCFKIWKLAEIDTSKTDDEVSQLKLDYKEDVGRHRCRMVDANFQ